MFKLIAPRDLAPIPAVATVAFVALAIFAWTERTIVVDPEGLSVSYWPWKMWQIAPLLMGFGGVWWVWMSTRRVPWVRSLALGTLALVVLANGYSGLFGDHSGNVWRTVNPLFIGSSSSGGGDSVAQRMRCGARGRGGFVDAGRPGICQRLLRQQWNSLAGIGPRADAYGAGLGRRRQPGQRRRHSRKRRVAG